MAWLPDTAVTSMSMNDKDVYAYAQTQNGDLYECYGTLGGYPENYVFEEKTRVVRRMYSNQVVNEAPKLFTPVAAAHLGNDRYLFYVDDSNNLRDIVKKGTSSWQYGTLNSDLKLKCAGYSSLAAVTVTNRWGTSISLVYQTTDKLAGLATVNFKQGQNNWSTNDTRVYDPPMFGTSLTAIAPRPDLIVNKSAPESQSGLPIVYLQLDDLRLAHSQGKEVRAMEDKGDRFAPHTSLSAVDDGLLQYFFTTLSDNYIKRVIWSKDGPPSYDIMAKPTPRSAIAAVKVKQGKIALFYQALDDDKTEKVKLWCKLLSSSGGIWNGTTQNKGSDPVALDD